MTQPEIDDRGPESEPVEIDPACKWCADTGWRPVITAEGFATTKRCDRCWQGEDD